MVDGRRDEALAAGASAALGVRLEQMVPGVRVRGVVGSQPVDVVSVRWVGSNFLILTFRHEGGATEQRTLGRDQEPSLSLESQGGVAAFDADPEAWRLAAEALRVRYAALFDPMLAITGSNLEPLPHQITAVYSQLLRRSPLRFLLADDPGAGKTIMCGLYIKELMLRGDLKRCLVVTPGGLVEQWQEELYTKFGLRFELLTRSLIDANIDGNVFDQHDLLIARMDQLSRNDDLLGQLRNSDWDFVAIDEAHRMSATYQGAELKTTKRYRLGQVLGTVCRHLLLMTATPHAGKQDDFQLFMALLDGDRFEGRYRDGVHTSEPNDLILRRVKEDLLTMDGRPLFPERRAYSVDYRLSHDEMELYDAVSQYVREEMNRAERLGDEGDRRRGNTVGFALTVLQRRLASSPEAILKSLERRKARLDKRRRELTQPASSDDLPLQQRLDQLLGRTDLANVDEDLDDLDSAEVEELEEHVVDAATAARTVAELDKEILMLADLVELAQRVRRSGTDRKWLELRTLLLDNELTHDAAGNLRKIIVFTEHRDTLNYLVGQIRDLIGMEAVVAVHGGVRREMRRNVQERFTQDKDVRILVATDAAGEGINLQVAHLMVNYDLPWNPNRIEQRFGRIHRIGQTETCHLWNLVARDTREGEVYLRLLEKVEEQRKSFQDKVFDVLGEAFVGRPLRQLLIDALRYGDRPDVRAHFKTVIDQTVGEGVDRLLRERALDHELYRRADAENARLSYEDAQARRLQPHYVEAFFRAAFTRLGGRISPQEQGRFEVTHVPQEIRDRDRQVGAGASVLSRYHRVTYLRDQERVPGLAPAGLLAPGHPLLDAVVDLTIDRNSSLVKHGTALIDRGDVGTTPRLLVAMLDEISDGHRKPVTVSKRFSFVEITASGATLPAGHAPYLDYEPATDDERRKVLQSLLAGDWLARGAEELAEQWAIEHSLTTHLQEVQAAVDRRVNHTRAEVRRRLEVEIAHWDHRYHVLLDEEAVGKQSKIRPETAQKRARDLEHRLADRLADLDACQHLSAHPPVVVGTALVVPQGLLDQLRLGGDRRPSRASDTHGVGSSALETVLAAERSLGREPEVAQNSRTVRYDVCSRAPDGTLVRIAIRSRTEGGDTLVVTRNDTLTAKNLGDDYRLALVRLSSQEPERYEVRYMRRPFDSVATDDFRATRFTHRWDELWSRSGPPC